MNCISIDNRMKEYYEKRNRNFLIRRLPVIIRIDGKAFHTYTKRLKKPFDLGLIEDMQQTTKFLCENIQGCKFGYVQSDEISLVLTDYDTLQTDAWVDYCQNKIESISASMATGFFNHFRFQRYFSDGVREHFMEETNWEDFRITIGDICNYFPIGTGFIANFDARSFNIPKEEVANYFIWRQQDATKNSISMLAQSLYSHQELHGKNSNEMQELCFQKGINWNDLSTSQKRGTAVYLNKCRKDLTGKITIDKLKSTNEDVWFDADGKYGIYTNQWKIDLETPIFTQNRELIENLII